MATWTPEHEEAWKKSKEKHRWEFIGSGMNPRWKCGICGAEDSSTFPGEHDCKEYIESLVEKLNSLRPD